MLHTREAPGLLFSDRSCGGPWIAHSIYDMSYSAEKVSFELYTTVHVQYSLLLLCKMLETSSRDMQERCGSSPGPRQESE